MAKISQPAFRRLAIVITALLALVVWLIANPANYQPKPAEADTIEQPSEFSAIVVLEKLEVNSHYTEQKYVRTNFYSNWSVVKGCDMRNIILQRDLVDTKLDGCLVLSGILHDPYTGKTIDFIRGPGTSSAVQIDHVVALSNAWSTGAYRLDKTERKALSQDPLNLLAVDGPANQQKSDKDASEWLPPNVAFQCQYVARQISIKFKYILWVTQPEKSAMQKVLQTCPNEPTVGLENPQP
ncbi:HNH endonuclease family protein [Candidatus Saccharibacteria bacterium]|nr:HNH endonuclease family protein [Candidatus Saccharibacteria bacterium]